jgi:hypothetical protein
MEEFAIISIHSKPKEKNKESPLSFTSVVFLPFAFFFFCVHTPHHTLT